MSGVSPSRDLPFSRISQNPQSEFLSSSSQPLHFSLPSLLPSFPQILSTHLLHLLLQQLGHSLNLLLLLLLSTLIFWFATNPFSLLSSISINPKRLGLITLYLIISCLFKTILLFFSHWEGSHLSFFQSLFLHCLSALIITLAIHFRMYWISSHPQPTLYLSKEDLLAQMNLAKRTAEEQELLGATLSHESRNVLNCLTNTLDFIESDVDFNLPRAKEGITGAKHCCETLLHYFNNYLENQKPAEAQRDWEEAGSTPVEVLQKVQSIIKSAVKSKKLTSKLVLEKNIPNKISIKESSLLQILLNLVYNAIKFTDNGSIEVKLGWRHSSIEGSSSSSDNKSLATMSTQCESPRQLISSIQNILSETKGLSKGKLIITVSDTGCGMNEKDVQMLFKPFSQPHSDPAKRRQGTGLGLWLTKNLIEKLGGHVKVESKVGKGSTFTIFLDCQAKIEEETLFINKESDIFAKKEECLLQVPKKAGVILTSDAMESSVLKAYMKNAGFETVSQMSHLEDLWKYLDANKSEEAIIVLDEKNLSGLNGLYQWNKSLLDNKAIITIEDANVKVSCLAPRHQRLERPVRLDDFKGAALRV